MSPLRRTTATVFAAAVLLVGAVVLLGGHAHRNVVTRPANRARPARPVAPPRQAAIATVEHAFVAAYLAYLDGAGSSQRLPYASITAREQATRGGRIPPPFRDGALHVTRVSGASTAYSAQATVTAANRSESYLETVQLLLTQHGWQVAQLTTPDLAIDDGTRPVSGPPVPAVGQTASRAFAIAYAIYRDTTSAAAPAAMTATARSELEAGQDPLAGAARATEQPRLRALRFGPLQGTEFSVTATVHAGEREQQFTVLMVKQAGRWECDAFL